MAGTRLLQYIYGIFKTDANGDPIAFDSTDKEKVSVYGTGTVAGDTALKLRSWLGDGQSSAGDAILAKVALFGNTGSLISDGGGHTANAAARTLLAAKAAYNGTTFDAWRRNLSGSLLASAARTTTQNVADQTNYNWRGIHVILDVTDAGTGSITLKIEGKDSVSGKYYTLLEGVAVTSNSTNVYKVFPGAPATANVSANDLLPETWRVTVTANNANSITYSVGYSIIV